MRIFQKMLEILGTVITQVEVSRDNLDFDDPSKSVGPFYRPEETLQLREEKIYMAKEVPPGKEKSWRRVVPTEERWGLM